MVCGRCWCFCQWHTNDYNGVIIMSYISQIVVDGVAYDVQAKALDSTLDATILKKTNLVNGFTQTEAGVNALDAAAGKTLNDTKANLNYPALRYRIGNNDSADGYPRVELRESGNATQGRHFVIRKFVSSSSNTDFKLVDKNGNFCPSLAQGLITTSLTSNVESTVDVSFVQSEARMLFIASSSYANSRGIYIITASAVIPVVEASNATTLTMTSGTLHIKLTTAARIVIV